MTETNLPTPARKINNTFYRRTGLVFTGLGLVLFVIGAKPDWFGLNISVAIGFVQIGVFSFGLLLICLGGTFALRSLWPSHWRSIPADIGLRLAWSGVVMALISAMADIIGLGTRPLSTSFIFFGFWQARGVLVGEALMLIGFLMMVPFKEDFPPPPAETTKEGEDGDDEQDEDNNPPAEEDSPLSEETPTKIKLEIE